MNGEKKMYNKHWDKAEEEAFNFEDAKREGSRAVWCVNVRARHNCAILDFPKNCIHNE